jgi:hypothetical protein
VAYLTADLEHFVRRAPYLELSRPESAKRFLGRQLALLSQSHIRFDGYPELQVEHLEFFYATLRSLTVLDVSSLGILLTEITWRGVVWGGWLALLRPKEEFAELLGGAATQREDNLWAVRSALAFLERRSPPSELTELADLAGRVRDALSEVPLPSVPIRVAPTGAERSALDAEVASVRRAYRSRGTAGALRALEGTRIYELSIPYTRWCAEFAGGRHVALP